jgi:hypothetical protein
MNLPRTKHETTHRVVTADDHEDMRVVPRSLIESLGAEVRSYHFV